MNESQKISIRFLDDREVRALWDESSSKWWFSVLDIIAVLTNQVDYGKTRNYWKYLKAKLKKEGSQVVSTTTQLKLLAPDGKKRLSDMLDYEGIFGLQIKRNRKNTLFINDLKFDIRDLRERDFIPQISNCELTPCSLDFAIPKQCYRISNPTKLVSAFPNIRTINPEKQKSLKYLWDTQISNIEHPILNVE